MSSAPSGPAVALLRTYRPMLSRVLGWVLVGILGLTLLFTLIGELIPGLVAWVAFGLVITWLLLLRPGVTLSASGVTIANLLRDTDIPWRQIESLGSRWALEVRTADGREFSSWAVPAQRSFRPRSRDVDSPSEAAATLGLAPGQRLTAERMMGVIETARVAQARGDLGRPGGDPGSFDRVQVRWSVPALAALLVTAVTALGLSFF